MDESAKARAKELLKAGPGGLETLRVHEFADDEEAHDDEGTEKLYAEFSTELDRVQTELTRDYGPPARSGETNDEIIPLCGVFRFVVWDVGDSQLFVAASHEDRGVPILLMIGTA